MTSQRLIEQIRKFGGFLPVCASCGRARDDNGSWFRLEAELLALTETQFSHGICPECAQRLYPQYFCPDSRP